MLQCDRRHMTLRPPPVQVSWIHSAEDQPIARELLRLAHALDRQGPIRNRLTYGPGMTEAQLTEKAGELERRSLPRNQAMARHPHLDARLSKNHMVGGDIAVFLISPAALADSSWQLAMQDALREGGPR